MNYLFTWSLSWSDITDLRESIRLSASLTLLIPLFCRREFVVPVAIFGMKNICQFIVVSFVWRENIDKNINNV
jgi:hypothetical protein